MVIRNDGQIMWDQPAISKSSCSVDVSFFPFDAQQCRLTFGSWTHNGNQMDLVNALDSADLADFVANVEWEVRLISLFCHFSILYLYQCFCCYLYRQSLIFIPFLHFID